MYLQQPVDGWRDDIIAPDPAKMAIPVEHSAEAVAYDKVHGQGAWMATQPAYADAVKQYKKNRNTLFMIVGGGHWSSPSACSL